MTRTLPAELRASRRDASDRMRARVIEALENRVEGQSLTREAVAQRAGVAPNFISRHKDLADLRRRAIAAERRGDNSYSPRHEVQSRESLLAQIQNQESELVELREEVRILKRRLTGEGFTPSESAVTLHPASQEGRRRAAELEVDVRELRAQVRNAEAERDAAKRVNRELAKQVMLLQSPQAIRRDGGVSPD